MRAEAAALWLGWRAARDGKKPLGGEMICLPCQFLRERANRVAPPKPMKA